MFYCDEWHFPLPEGHKFPLTKYRLLREALSEDRRFRMEPAQLAQRSDIVQIHEPVFVDAFLEGTLAPAAMRRIGFPASPQLVTRTLASVGSTLCAARSAMRTGFGGTLAGGTHHAYRNEGSGFCVFNDLAIAIATLRAETGLRKAAIIDLDVHQGDGTASIFSDDRDVFTLSLHGEKNFPLRKQISTLDVSLPDGTTDAQYLEALRPALNQALGSEPEVVFFQAGVDALESDCLGRLALSLHGMRERDNLVVGEVRRRKIPLVITIGGGYSNPIDLTVAAHARTFLTAADHYFSCDLN